MQLRPLGRGAPPVSIVGYGGMHLSLAGRPPENVALRVIHAGLDAGMTLIDTADVYCLDQNDIGHNERLVAQALKTWSGPRDQVIVATKGGMIRPDGRWERDARPERLRRACERSLQALQVDRIDLYQLHAPDHQVPFEESVGALAELQREGKIRWIGLSNVSVAEIKAAEAITEVATVQNRLNPFFREAIETGVVRYCGERGHRVPGLQPDRRWPAHQEAAGPPGAAAHLRRARLLAPRAGHCVGPGAGSHGALDPERTHRGPRA